MPRMADRITEAQKEALERELADLEGPKRAEMVRAIATARSFGDLSENFEYHAAKNEQGLLERRITILRARLESSELVDEVAAATSGRVEVGSLIELEDERGERLRVELSSVGGAGTVSPDSPLGRALLGARVGDTVEVEAPKRPWQARVLSLERP